MNKKGIMAYDLPERVASYDADMAVMHPNRAKMIRVALEILPFSTQAPLRALDRGVGSGYFAEHFLRHYQNATVVAIDGASAMVDLAKARLGELGDRTQFVVGDFRDLSRLVPEKGAFGVVFSSYALHHLNGQEKQSVIGQSLDLLCDEGWFVNADLIVSETPEMEERIQTLRVEGIVQRANGHDARFKDFKTTRAFLDGLEYRDGDQPLTLMADLHVLKAAGVRSASVFWLEHREAVCGGKKGGLL